MEPDAIKEICQERGIETLIHFTNIDNLAGILQHGLLSRKELKDDPTLNSKYQFNDSCRLDGCVNAVCLSITFPNYKMFHKYSNEDKTKWVVIQLDASLLWELDCAFCKENAASNNESYIPIDDRKQAAYLERMFESYGDLHRSALSIPDNYPTNPQAEVLVFERIDPKYFSAINFKLRSTAEEWIKINGNPWPVEVCSGDTYFSPRQDYMYWKPTTQDTIVKIEMM